MHLTAVRQTLKGVDGKVLFYPLRRIETPSIRACFSADNRNALYSRERKVSEKRIQISFALISFR